MYRVHGKLNEVIASVLQLRLSDTVNAKVTSFERRIIVHYSEPLMIRIISVLYSKFECYRYKVC